MESADDLLARYKKHPFAKGLLPFGPTLKTLDSPFGRIVAKEEGRQRWVICDKETGDAAIFSHAAVFAESDDLETGNYVPGNEVVPPGIDVKVLQRRANTRCFYTYVLDTFVDKSLYEGQWELDDYMSHVPGFNPKTLPRRPYLSGHDERYRSRFWMQTPMFLRSGGDRLVSDGIGHLHKWVVDADRQSKVFRANPDRPRIWMKEGGAIVPIGEREPGSLQRGDIMGVSFTVTYHVTNSNWFPQFHPVDFVVLKSGDGDVTDYAAPRIDLASRPPPTLAGDDVDEGVNTGLEEGEIGSGRGADGNDDDSVAHKPAGDVGDGPNGDGLGEDSLRRKRSLDTLASSDGDDEGRKEVQDEGIEMQASGLEGSKVSQEVDDRALRTGGSKRSVRRRL